MNRIDRLIIKAKRSSGTELVLATVEQVDDAWKTELHLQNKGQAVEIRESLHPTMEMAIDHIHAMADLTIIVDDLSG